jgi:hypothetical protein
MQDSANFDVTVAKHSVEGHPVPSNASLTALIQSSQKSGNPKKPPNAMAFPIDLPKITTWLGERPRRIKGTKPSIVVVMSTRSDAAFGFIEMHQKDFQDMVRAEQARSGNTDVTAKIEYLEITQEEADKLTGVDRFEDPDTDKVDLSFE